MKHDTTSKLKFKKLRRVLGDPPLYHVVGLLESLWQLTAADAPLGDIGKFSNDDIAIGIEWQGDPDKLIEALVATKWLDKSDNFRLVIHHWDQHVPDYLKKRVQRQGESFVTGQNGESEPANASASDNGEHRRTLADSGCLPNQTEPDQTQPNPTKPNPLRGASGLEKAQLSDSGGNGELSTLNGRIAHLLRIKPPALHPDGSRAGKQAMGDFVTISRVLEHCRGDPAALGTLARLATEVADGEVIRKPCAAWVQRVKDAELFYK